MLKITATNYDELVARADKPVLLDFWASWCGPCRMLSPIVDEIADERGDIKVGKVNVDEQPELANNFGVMSIPTLLLMKNGKVVEQYRKKPHMIDVPDLANTPPKDLTGAATTKVKMKQVPKRNLLED